MNMKKINLILAALFFATLSACGQASSKDKLVPGSSEDVNMFPGAKPNSYWKNVLSQEAYDVMVNKGTEPPIS